MQDLSANLFYKAKFTISTNDANNDLLWKLVLEIKNWLTTKWNKDNHLIVDPDIKKWTRFKNTGRIYDEENTNHVYAESALHISEDSITTSWACKVVEKNDPIEGYAQREWITEIGYQSSRSNEAELSYVVTYNDLPGFIGFCEDTPSITVPRIIRHLLTDNSIECKIGANQLSFWPIQLKVGEYPTFKKILYSTDRVIPVIYLSPYQQECEDGETIVSTLVDPNKLARSVAANAIVLYSNDMDFAREMNWFMGGQYGCFGGAIRVYRPNINPNDPSDRFRHRFLPSSFIIENGEDTVLNIFRRALAQDVHYYDTLFRLENCQELLDEDRRQKRIALIRAKSENVIDEAMREYLDESDKRAAAERKAREYQEELDKAKSDIYALQIRNDSLKEAAEKAKDLAAAIKGVREINAYPSDPASIATYFEVVYPERIIFTERAKRSLVDCQTRPDYLWEAFFYIATELYDLLHDYPSQAKKLFKERTGWECSRGVGTNTHADSKLMKQYIDIYNGQEISIEAHIKNGVKDSDPKSVRIYYAYEPQLVDKIIIGHCGKHLDNYSTKSIK